MINSRARTCGFAPLSGQLVLTTKFKLVWADFLLFYCFFIIIIILFYNRVFNGYSSGPIIINTPQSCSCPV